MTNASLLERYDIPDIPDTPAVLLSEPDIVAAAREKLGYHSPDFVNPKIEQAKVEARARYDAALRAAGIRPFTRDSVNRYKAAEVARQNAASSAVVAAAQQSNAWFRKRPFPEASVAAVTPLPWEWRRTPLSFYTGQVPADALRLALRVQDALEPAGLMDSQSRDRVAEFYARFNVAPGDSAVLAVDALTQRHRHADPFLVLVTPNEEYYLAVWGEERYEAELTA